MGSCCAGGVATTPGGAAASGQRDTTVEAAQRPYAVKRAAGQGEAGKAPAKRAPTIEIKLSAADYMRFSELCRMEGKTRTDLARTAIRNYMDKNTEDILEEEKDRLIEAISALHGGQKYSTERLAKMIARLMMDIGTLMQVFYERADKEIRDDLWAVSRKRAAQRLTHKRKDGDPEATEIMKHALGGEA